MRMCVYVCVQVREHLYVCFNLCVCMCVCMCVHVCVHVCAWTGTQVCFECMRGRPFCIFTCAEVID